MGVAFAAFRRKAKLYQKQTKLKNLLPATAALRGAQPRAQSSLSAGRLPGGGERAPRQRGGGGARRPVDAKLERAPDDAWERFPGPALHASRLPAGASPFASASTCARI